MPSQPSPPMQTPPNQSQAHDAASVAGFVPLAIARIREAQQLNRVAVVLVCLALACFMFFGTLASVASFRDSRLMYLLFHYLPYALVGLSIPLSLYDAFIIHRYRLNQPSILILSVGIASALLVICLLWQLENWLWLAMASWVGVAFLFKANFKRFFNFLQEQSKIQTQHQPTEDTKVEAEAETKIETNSHTRDPDDLSS